MKLIFIIILFCLTNLISANELENNEVEVINLHESKSLDQMVDILQQTVKEENDNLKDNEMLVHLGETKDFTGNHYSKSYIYNEIMKVNKTYDQIQQNTVFLSIAAKNLVEQQVHNRMSDEDLDDMQQYIEEKIAINVATMNNIDRRQNEVSKITLPEELSKNGEHFGLKVSGDSMIEAGINDGDTVIVKKANTANNGQIVVALIDDHEAMLKRIRKKGKIIALESANKNYETKIFGPDRVKVQGILVSLYRNF